MRNWPDYIPLVIIFIFFFVLRHKERRFSNFGKENVRKIAIMLVHVFVFISECADAVSSL